MIKIKNRRMGILLTIPLTLALGLIFFLQQEFFTEEAQGFGTALLLSVLSLEVISHISLFRSKAFLSKAIFAFISAVLVAFSTFITYAVLINLSASEHERRQEIRDNAQTQRVLLVSRIDSIKEEIKSKQNTIKEIQGTKRGWMISNINKDIKSLNADWKSEKAKYFAIIATPITKASVIDTLSSQLGINAGIISALNKAFIALILSLVPISLCYLISTLFIIKKEEAAIKEDKEDKEDNVELGTNENKVLVFEKASKKLKIGKEELAYRLGVSLNYLNALEKRGKVPKSMQQLLYKALA